VSEGWDPPGRKLANFEFIFLRAGLRLISDAQNGQGQTKGGENRKGWNMHPFSPLSQGGSFAAWGDDASSSMAQCERHPVDTVSPECRRLYG
jgi:hypothetical protein